MLLHRCRVQGGGVEVRPGDDRVGRCNRGGVEPAGGATNRDLVVASFDGLSWLELVAQPAFDLCFFTCESVDLLLDVDEAGGGVFDLSADLGGHLFFSISVREIKARTCRAAK